MSDSVTERTDPEKVIALIREERVHRSTPAPYRPYIDLTEELLTKKHNDAVERMIRDKGYCFEKEYDHDNVEEGYVNTIYIEEDDEGHMSKRCNDIEDYHFRRYVQNYTPEVIRNAFNPISMHNVPKENIDIVEMIGYYKDESMHGHYVRTYVARVKTLKLREKKKKKKKKK